MFDLLLGSPGKTDESIAKTIGLMRKAGPDRVGIAVGVRVYSKTKLAEKITQRGKKEGLFGSDGPEDPLLFIEPEVYPFIFDMLDDLIGVTNDSFSLTPPILKETTIITPINCL